MKRILFLFTASLLFLACSNDDNNGPDYQQELKIKKYTSLILDANGNPKGQKVEYFFDENGKKLKDHIIDDFYDYIWEYTYNDLGQVTKKSHNHVNLPVDIVEEYIYNSENKLKMLNIDSDNDGVVNDSLIFTYHNYKTIAQWSTPGSESREFYYNNDWALISKKHFNDLGIIIDEIITYDNSQNITELIETESPSNFQRNYKYEYDGKPNPFYKEFHNFSFNVTWRDGGFLSKYPLFFSPNNATKITRTSSDSSENFISETTYQYNTSNYPVSSQSKINGTLFSQATFEYY